MTTHVLCSAIVLIAAATSAQTEANSSDTATEASTQIIVENFKNADMVRYPLVFLRGTIPEDSLQLAGGKEHCLTVQQGKFKALVELEPGVNSIVLVSGEHRTVLRLVYKPATTDYLVKPFFLLAADDPETIEGESMRRAKDKLSTALKLYQCFTAEEMNLYGFGRKTFHLPYGKTGTVKVQVIRAKETSEELAALSNGEVYSLIQTQYALRDGKTIMVVVSKYASGLGGKGLTVSMSDNIRYWARSVSDIIPAFMSTGNDNPSFSWKISAIGPSLHEIGHALSLPHPGDFALPGEPGELGLDRRLYITGRAQSRIVNYFTFVGEQSQTLPTWGDFTKYLNYSRWFYPVKPPTGKLDPTAKIEEPGWVTLRARNGLGAVIYEFLAHDETTGRLAGGKRAVTDDSIAGKPLVRISMADLVKRYDVSRCTLLMVRLIDQAGGESLTRFNLDTPLRQVPAEEGEGATEEEDDE